jgi:PAS domain S-box-containing protein
MDNTNPMADKHAYSEEFLHTVFLQAGDGIALVADQKFIAANPRTCEMFGFTHEEIIGLPLMDLVPEDEISRVTKILGVLAETGLVCEETVFYRKDRSRIDAEITGRMLSNGQILGIMRDITSRKQAENALKESQAQIVEDERMMASFRERERLARELHDSLGQTFAYLNMQLDAVRELIRAGDNEGGLRLLVGLSEVAQESHRDLRYYIQGLTNQAPAIHQEFFAALERYCQHYESAYQFQVRLNLPDSLPVVLASTDVETHLIYIIREAIGNARQYSGQKHADVTIAVEDDTVQAVIEDHGVGFRVHSGVHKDREEAHFGLKIMCERAEQVGGTVSIDSAPGQGTRVRVSLPRKLVEGGAFTARVLLADDHPLFIEGLRNMLALRGIKVVGEARDGIEAHAMARALKPDLILMDINMPRMDGIVATRMIKAEMPRVKVVMLTTSVTEEDVLGALKVGAAGYLPKGMSADEFMLRLGEIMRGEAEFSAEMAKRLLEMFTHTNPDQAKLTERQVEIIRMVAHGATYREIGDRLFLTERTVKYHMGEIFTRLGITGREKAEEFARRRGLV